MTTTTKWTPVIFPVAAVVICLLAPLAVVVLNWLALAWHFPEDSVTESTWVKTRYLLTGTAMTSVFPIAMCVRRFFPESRLTAILVGRVLLFAGAIASLYWIAIPVLVLSELLFYSHADPSELVLTSLVVFAVAAIIAEFVVHYGERGQ